MSATRLMCAPVLGLGLALCAAAPAPPPEKPGQRDTPATPPAKRFEREVLRLNGPGPVTALAFAPDGRSLAAAHGKSVVLWDLPTRKQVHRWQVPGTWTWVSAISFSPDGRTVAAAGGGGARAAREDDPPALLWDARTGKLVRGLGDPRETCRSIAFSPDGKTIAFGGLRLLGFDSATGKLLWNAYPPKKLIPGKVQSEPKAADVWHLAWSPDGRTLAAVSSPNVLTLWTADGKRLAEVNGQRGRRAPLGGLAFAPDGKALAWRQPDRSVRLVEPRTGRTLRQLPPPKDAGEVDLIAVYCVAFTPDGALLASAERDVRSGLLVLYDAPTGKEVHRVTDKEYRIEWIAFSPDGKLLALGGVGAAVHLLGPLSPTPLELLDKKDPSPSLLDRKKSPGEKE
jgi:WD40 repeat protein